MRLDVGTRAVGRGVVVRDEADGGHLLFDVRLQRGVEIALVVELHVAEALALKFRPQVFGKNQLFRRTRHALAVLSRLRVEFGVVKESFGNIHFFVLYLSAKIHIIFESAKSSAVFCRFTS